MTTLAAYLNVVRPLAIIMVLAGCGGGGSGGAGVDDTAPGSGSGGTGGAGVPTGNGGAGGAGAAMGGGGAGVGGAPADAGARPGGASMDGSSGGARGGAGGTADAAPPASVPPGPSSWVNVTGDLATQAAGGGDLSIVSAKPDSARVIVGIGKKGLWASDDAGKSWFRLGTGAGSATIDNGPTAIVYDPSNPDTFWESGIYGAGVFKTTDNGSTFKRLGSISHNDLVSVDFTDPERKTLLAGAHETKRKLFLSRDGGATWMDIGQSLPADSSFSSAPQIIDTKTFLLGSCGFGGGACGVYRSADGGVTWTRATSEGPNGRPLLTAAGALYWPLIYDRGVIVSSDQGQSWTKGGAGPIQNQSGAPAELPDGRVVMLGKKYLLATADGGKTWKEIGDPLPFPGANCGIYGVTYSRALKRFFINHNDCKGMILPTAVYSAGFDASKP